MHKGLLYLLVTTFITGFLVACSGGYRAPVGEVSSGPRYWDTDREHRVNAGESLYSVAWIYDIDYRLLAQANNLGEPYNISTGQILRVDVRGITLSTPEPAPRRVASTSAGTSAGSATTRPVNVRPAVVTTPLEPRAVESAPPATPVSKPETETRAVPTPEISGTLPEVSQQSTVVSVPADESDWLWPASGELITTFDAGSNGNKGIDIAGSRGDPVYATAEGEVVYAGSGLLRYGDFIIIKHNERYLSAYAHNDQLLVNEGEFVSRGQKIAEMGSSGISDVRLHFEIREEGAPADPLKFLPSSR